MGSKVSPSIRAACAFPASAGCISENGSKFARRSGPAGRTKPLASREARALHQSIQENGPGSGRTSENHAQWQWFVREGLSIFYHQPSPRHRLHLFITATPVATTKARWTLALSSRALGFRR
jgi:hypothetical protein